MKCHSTACASGCFHNIIIEEVTRAFFVFVDACFFVLLQCVAEGISIQRKLITWTLSDTRLSLCAQEAKQQLSHDGTRSQTSA